MADSYMKIGSERYYFNMYQNVERFDNGIKYVFCDELEEYTFHPDVKSLYEVPEYSVDRTAFKNVRIFIVVQETGKVLKVVCDIYEEQKKIYISHDRFNKFWKLISEHLCQSSSEITQASVNDRVDLTLMETPSRSAKVGPSFTIEYTGREIDIEEQRMISKKASAMEDHRLRFVYAKGDRVIHDKSCPLVEHINYWDFCAVEELETDKELCPRCKRKILIRSAIKYDTKRLVWYQNFFDEGRVSNRVLEQFLLGTDVELHMDTMEEMIIKCNEDTWRVKRNEQEQYSLYHNNYVRINEDERYITSEFHLQRHHPAYLAGILAYIQGYDWNKHRRTKIADVVEKKQEPAMEEKAVKVPFWKKVLGAIKHMLGGKGC